MNGLSTVHEILYEADLDQDSYWVSIQLIFVIIHNKNGKILMQVHTS